MTCGIYKITRKDTGQMYIGLSEGIEDRWYGHIYSSNLKCSYVDRAIKKYGADKFDLEIIEELPNDRPLLMKREKYWIAYYNTYENDFHYNLSPGGDFSPSKLPKVKAKISKAHKGKKIPEEIKEKISKTLSGRKFSQETKEKISKSMSGRKLSQKTREKLSKSHLGKKLPDKQKISISKTLNTSGYYRVCKLNDKSCKQGFVWAYRYYKNGKQKKISSIDIKKLEEKVRAKGLKWLKFD